MLRTTPNRESRDPQSQNRLNFVEPGEPGFEPETIARYRVALVREEATPYEFARGALPDVETPGGGGSARRLPPGHVAGGRCWFL